MVFPGATADREAADYAVVGAPLDISTTFQPGTRFGPERVRDFSRTFEEYDPTTESHFSALGVSDHGDVGAVGAIDDAEEYLTFLEGELRDLRSDGLTPLLVGGEHTVSVAGLSGRPPGSPGGVRWRPLQSRDGDPSRLRRGRPGGGPRGTRRM